MPPCEQTVAEIEPPHNVVRDGTDRRQIGNAAVMLHLTVALSKVLIDPDAWIDRDALTKPVSFALTSSNRAGARNEVP